MGILTFENDQFLMDGKPYRIISGAMHYFRILPEYWEDRLKKLKACGFNTVETYTCWNLHERKEGQFDFSGMLDIEKYIETAERLDLNVIIRPGPYICAEWEFGGLPSWLLSYPHLPLRCSDPLYLEKVRPYYQELLSRIRPHLASNGGRVMMMQVENEYGSYGDDKDYLREVEQIYRDNGIDCLLFTSDGSSLWTLNGGTLPHLLSVVNFGTKAKQHFQNLRQFKEKEPLMCGEFWSGWFDHWYEEHHTRTVDDIIPETAALFDCGASFNYYMFHGGTNFGFTNGANHDEGLYMPTVTSYDYCAPLSECGDRTPTYYALRDLIQEKTGVTPPDLEVEELPKAAYGSVALTEQALLFEQLDQLAPAVHSAQPKTMEELGQDFGYILYSTTLHGPFEAQELCFGQLHDRAHIFLNGKFLGLRERSRRSDSIPLQLGKGENARLDILIENMGRVNYGSKLLDRKGIIGGIRMGKQFHFGWEQRCLTMEDLSQLQWQPVTGSVKEQPVFLRGKLHIEGTPADTFVRLDGFTKGFVMVNGFNLGRYYNPAGPQKTLYLPAPLLKQGDNEIIVFESDGFETAQIELLAQPDLGSVMDMIY
ncbi:MAG: beta-galactosidase [Oscillospiraceae bacterium]|nr:beta-galactosidase [Oscillospiraceae bacterium]